MRSCKTYFRMKMFVATVCCYFLLSVFYVQASVIINHTSTDITLIPQAAIEQAKNNLHIAYGHTSHGSQLTTGMTGLVAFANGGGRGLTMPADIFAWNKGGVGGALDLHDYAMGGDVGSYPQWVNNTRTYLDDPGNKDVNVIIWSWCGQVGDKYYDGNLASDYLNPMVQLETEYPHVRFVYMTGHVDIWDDADNKAANQMIRDFCIANDKILYDFEDIEHYDPDGTYFEYVHDNCNYYDAPAGMVQGNWATEWQSSHTEGIDWYSCGSSHSQPVNANRKAYAAWWLWAVLGGWDPSGSNAGVVVVESGGNTAVIEGGADDSYQMVLETKPTTDVTITVIPDMQTDLGSGAGAAILLSFTTGNWNTAKSVNVMAYDDLTKECAHTGRITHSVVSADTDYHGIKTDSVIVNISEKESCLLSMIIPVIINQYQ